MESKFIQIQLIFFFKNEISLAFEDVSKKIKEIFGNDLISQVIGLPKDAPTEMPRVIVNDQNGFGVHIFKNKINIFSEKKDFWDSDKENIFKLLSYLNMHISRIGIANKYFITNYSIANLKKLLNSDLQKEDLKEITLRLNNSLQDNYSNEYNNIEIYEIATFADENNKTSNGILISRDINTLQTIDLVLDKENKEDVNNIISFGLEKSPFFSLK